MTIEVQVFRLSHACQCRIDGCPNSARNGVRIWHTKSKKYISIILCDQHKEEQIKNASEYLEKWRFENDKK